MRSSSSCATHSACTSLYAVAWAGKGEGGGGLCMFHDSGRSDQGALVSAAVVASSQPQRQPLSAKDVDRNKLINEESLMGRFYAGKQSYSAQRSRYGKKERFVSEDMVRPASFLSLAQGVSNCACGYCAWSVPLGCTCSLTNGVW